MGRRRWRDERRDRDELERAKREITGGRLHLARQMLLELENRRPTSGEVAYQLGRCEEGLGHADAAQAAWSRIKPASTFLQQASLGRARLLMNAGRFTPVESLLLSLPRDSRPEGRQAREALELLYRIQGRKDELRDLILETWTGSDNPSGVLRRLYLVDHGAFPVDYVRTALDSGDPDDDRVWLGKANLAVWCGQFDEARRWLVLCTRRRPGDVAVWRRAVEARALHGRR